MSLCGTLRRLCDETRYVRMIPILGPFVDQVGPVVPTPQFQKFPIVGETLVAFELPINKKTTLSVVFKDVKGNPAKVDGVPVWLVDNDAVGAVTPAADGMSCVLASVGPIGSGTVSMQADVDMGPGIKPLVGIFEFMVTAGEAATVEITAGALEDQTPAPVLGTRKR